jgi:hypothetical protein
VADATVDVAGSLAGAVRYELRRALRPPYETAVVVVGNGLLMTACWTLLPSAAVAALFRFHGPQAFAMILASWMYADVPATNLLGGDPVRSVAALDDPAALRRLWYAKNAVLWLFATPLAALAAVVIGAHEHEPVAAALTVLWIAAVPLGALGFAGWLGIRWPYHPLPLRYRWAARHRWRPMLVRWLILVLAPYLLVPALTVLVTLPSVLLWATVAPHDGPVSDGQFGWGLLAAAALAVTAWPLGHRYGSRLARRRGAWLAGFLGDPDRG